MSPILIATDLSPQAGHALTRACHIATRLQVPLVVLHIVDEQLPLMTRDQQCQHVRELLGAQVVLCQSGHPLPVQLRVEAGQVTDSILRAAEEQDVQLIIMGQHHKSHPELFVGTNLERVSRLAPIPVLLVAGEGDDYRSGLGETLFGGLAHTLLHQPPCDVLVAR